MFPFARIKTDNTPKQQIRKIVEELKELRAELRATPSHPTLTAEEYWDVVQAVSTLGYLLTDELGAVTMTKARLNIVHRCNDRGYYE